MHHEIERIDPQIGNWNLLLPTGAWRICLFARGGTDYKMTDACHSFFKGLIPELLSRMVGDWARAVDSFLKRTFSSETTNEAMALHVEAVFLAVMRVLGHPVKESDCARV